MRLSQNYDFVFTNLLKNEADLLKYFFLQTWNFPEENGFVRPQPTTVPFTSSKSGTETFSIGKQTVETPEIFSFIDLTKLKYKPKSNFWLRSKLLSVFGRNFGLKSY